MSNSEHKSDFVIIGGVAAGPKTAASLARRVPNARITLFQKGDMISYGACGLPYFASGDIGSIEELNLQPYGVPRSPDFFRRSKGFEVVTGAEVTHIDRDRRTVTVKMVETGKTFEHGYGKLVLATGSVPVEPSFPVADSQFIHHFTRPDDAIAFRRAAETGKVGKALIVGAGFIGCEVAEAAGGLWGIEVTLVEKENQVLPNLLDPEMAKLVQRELSKQGVEVVTGAGIEKIELDNNGSPIISITGRESITADYVFLSLGVRPEVSLAGECGLKIGTSGAIQVNSRMQTSDPDIYAGGDCVESIHQITGEKLHLPMGSLANHHGRVIAENLSGHECECPSVLGTSFLKVFEVNVCAVGLSESAAVRAGLPVAATWGTFSDKPDYYPDSQTITVKMVYNADNDRLLGLQTVGAGDACRRTDVFSAYLRSEATVDDLLKFEHGHAPPYSEALDPLHHLAALVKAHQRGLSFLSPRMDPADLGSDVVYIDVRETEEAASDPWQPDPEGRSAQTDNKPVVLNIPLNDLTERISELKPDQKTVIVCKRGSRSYQAVLILKNAGFSDVTFFAGGTAIVGG